jgi:hypothetical protein
MRRILLLIACGLLGCGGSGQGLSGSMCSVYDCAYSLVTIRQVGPTTIQIDYTDGDVATATTRAAVVVCDVANFVKGQELPATSVRHIAPDGVDFPPLTEGKCKFDTDLVAGQNVSGSFHATFTTQAGVERALQGDFSGPLVEVQ